MKLTIFVTLAHILLLFCFNLKKEVRETKKNKIIVRTENLRPLPLIKSEKLAKQETAIPVIIGKKEAPIQPAPKKTEAPKVVVKTPTKTSPKKAPPVAKKTAPTPSKIPEKKPPDKELLGLMKEGLNKIEKASSSLQKKGTTKSFEKIGALKSESLETTAQEISYAEELAIYLKHHLHFPDEGIMKLSLTLSCEGIVQTFKIISSTSSGNQTIAQRSISSISFPPFKDKFKERSKTFTIQINVNSN